VTDEDTGSTSVPADMTGRTEYVSGDLSVEVKQENLQVVKQETDDISDVSKLFELAASSLVLK